jgi:peptidoglycan hydrolase-like protein with peptidoglycan-binding domain
VTARLRVAAGVGAGVLALGAAAAAGVGGLGHDPAEAGDTPPPATAAVTRATLTDYEQVDGVLGYGEAVPLTGHGGTVTWLAAAGSTVQRGGPLCRIDNRPVTLLYGALPLYRPLAPGVEGPDVRQFEQNLAALGYHDFTVDDAYTARTADAVRAWQEKLGVPETGTVAAGQVHYAGGAVRVAEHKTRVGDQAGGPLLTIAGTSRQVTIDLAVDDQRLAVKGAAATVTLPDGHTVAGKVAAVGTTATAPAEGSQGTASGPATIPVTVTIVDQRALGTLDSAPVDVQLVAGQRKDVLTVPISALVALSEGGYGVQVVDGATTTYVPVELGLFAAGRVEVSGAGLAAGTKVGMPS